MKEGEKKMMIPEEKLRSEAKLEKEKQAGGLEYVWEKEGKGKERRGVRILFDRVPSCSGGSPSRPRFLFLSSLCCFPSIFRLSSPARHLTSSSHRLRCSGVHFHERLRYGHCQKALEGDTRQFDQVEQTQLEDLMMTGKAPGSSACFSCHPPIRTESLAKCASPRLGRWLKQLHLGCVTRHSCTLRFA